MSENKVERCGVLMTPAGISKQIYCTEPVGHTGDHICTIHSFNPVGLLLLLDANERVAALESALRQLVQDVRKINNSPGVNLGIDRLSNPIEERLQRAEVLLAQSGTQEGK